MKRTTFDELIAHGRHELIAHGVPLTNDMPWSFMFAGCAVTHERDDCYLIATPNLGAIELHPGDVLVHKDQEFAVIPAGKSVAHLSDFSARRFYEDGMSKWDPATPPDLAAPYPENQRRTTGRLRHCSYCGSMHPTDLVAAIRLGAHMHWADFKYGWPHKAYVENIPNPHAGMLESRYGSSQPGEYMGKPLVKYQNGYDRHTGDPTYSYRDQGSPASERTHGKFYTEHLLDASPEERDFIEKAMGYSFCWHEGQVWYGPYRPGGVTHLEVKEQMK
jgi:hypothetical protein